MKIFDFHLHPLYDFNGVSLTPEEFVARLKENGVTFCAGSVIYDNVRSRPIEDYREIIPRLNAEAFEFYKKFPDFYTPGIHIHPAFSELSCKEIEKYADLGVKLVGELVYYMMGWSGYGSRELYEILRVAADRKMTLNIHPTRHDTDGMERLAASLPDMNIVIAHLDGYGLYDWSIEMMQKYKNVYFDISAYGAKREGMLRDAVNRVGAEKILYGTDFPGDSQKPYVDAVLGSGLNDDERELILCKNAERLLSL